MNNEAKKTRRTLAASAINLGLCTALFAGATFAWFTDTASTPVSTIKTGNLNVDIKVWNGSAYVSDAPLFASDAIWEPGAVQVAKVQISNTGSTSLKYSVTVKGENETKGVNQLGNTFRLSDYLCFGLMEAADAAGSREEIIANVQNGTGLNNTTDTMTLAVGESKEMALVVYMPSTVGNEANHNGTAPTLDLSMEVNATQNDGESDAFGSDYDKNLEVIKTSSAADKVSSAAAGATVNTGAGIFNFDFAMKEGMTLTGEGGATVFQVEAESPVALGSGLKNVTLKDLTVNVAKQQDVFSIKSSSATLDTVNLYGGGTSTYSASLAFYGDNLTVKDTTISGGFRGIQLWSLDGELRIENSVITPTAYTFNIDAGTGTIVVNDSILRGWTSYTTSIQSATFTNTIFEKSTGGYNVVAAFTNTTFEGCDFRDGFTPLARTSSKNIVWTFNNCTMDGTLITPQNVKEMLQKYSTADQTSDIWNGCTLVVNGETIAADAA